MELQLCDLGDAFIKMLPSHRLFRNTKTGYWYVETHSPKKLFALHRLLVRAKEGELVYHANGNKNDNRLSNLRVCTKRTNAFNSKRRSDATLRHRGVIRNTGCSTFSARAGKIYLGSYRTQEEAAVAYDRYMRKHYPDFAKLNFPLDEKQ